MNFFLGKFARKVSISLRQSSNGQGAYCCSFMVRRPHPKHFIVFLSLTLAVANFFQVSKRLKLNTRRLLVRTLVGNIHSTLPHFINAIPAFHSFHKFYNKSNNNTIQDRREINNAVSVEADV